VYFIDCYEIIVVVELVNGWELSVPLLSDWHVRISESVAEFLSLLFYNIFTTDANDSRLSCLIEFFLLLLNGLLLVAYYVS
jgi:hypothetical protein